MPIPPFGAAPFKSPLTTKGDIFGFSTTKARVPVGSDGFPLLADSGQSVGVGYATRAFNFNNQQLLNANILTIGNAAAPGNGPVHLFDGTTQTFSSNISSPAIWQQTGTYTISASQGFTTGYEFNIGNTWNFNVATPLNFAAIAVTSTYQGSNHPGTMFSLNFVPSFGLGGTLANYSALNMNPTVNSGTITKMVLAALGNANSGTITTCIGLDVGVTNSLAGSTIWAMQIGNYNSYFNGNTTFGGTSAPTWNVHVRGGSASVNAVGWDVSTVPPVEPASSAGMAVQLYEGSGGTNRYFLISYNDAGTQRYKYLQLNGTGVTWVTGTTPPT